jgi:hypothetical protein
MEAMTSHPTPKSESRAERRCTPPSWASLIYRKYSFRRRRNYWRNVPLAGIGVGVSRSFDAVWHGDDGW